MAISETFQFIAKENFGDSCYKKEKKILQDLSHHGERLQKPLHV